MFVAFIIGNLLGRVRSLVESVREGFEEAHFEVGIDEAFEEIVRILRRED